MANNKPDTLDQTFSADKDATKPTGRRSRRRATSTIVRRSQKRKRRGPIEKRRGLNEKRRSQEEKKEGVTVKRTWNDGKRRWDKKHYCVFCRRPQVKIARHLLRKHADQQEVLAASVLPTGSKQRHLLLEHLRCRGNYMHNIEVIRQGSGEIVPWRQPSEEVDARNYLPCPLCLGFFLRADLWKHQASCRKKMSSDPSRDSAPSGEKTSDPSGDSAFLAARPTDPSEDRICDSTGEEAACDQEEVRISESTEDTPSDPSAEQNNGPKASNTTVHQNLSSDSGADPPRKRSRVQAAASRLLPISSGASESCSEVLHRMNQDHVSHQVKSDWLICKYGNKLMGNQDGGQRRYDYVSQKLRELGRFLLAAKSLDPAVQTLQDLLAPGHLSLALSAARKASGYRWSRPPLAVKTTLKTVCEIAIGESLQDGDWEAAAKTTDFYHLLGREWDKLGLQDPDTGGGAKTKKQYVQSGGEKESKEPEIPPQSRLEGSVMPPESRQQIPLTALSLPAPRKVRRRPWSSAEKEAVWRQLGVHVLVQSVPGKEVCQRCLDLEPVLRGRHWKDIKNQVHNQIQSQKKQQFHAQMDLHEDQDQQDQNQRKQLQYLTQMDTQDKDQNHKKHQQYPMDQHDQDSIQTKKKPQYQVHLDQQDPGNTQNHKKLQFLTQLDPQDHLQNLKKQLCHTRLDHQDHLQIHKKQMFQLDQQTQELQANLDQNSPLLTGTSFGPDGPHRAPGQTLLERDPTINPYPLPHRTLGPHMDQLLTRTEWTDPALVQHYRSLEPGGPADPHSGHVHF
ncbi:uncharacterized protein LOC122870113 [Xyrichtys novacula]|uniref:Uncharacterized protein LOC122870113 n=1 Tax=Xyrichtys novacula TaxID=13765 RepID=A0AAV1EI64_XYRNO|nr:uncharacterized protein LOC122870113 [Xyrichtys novacula]